MTTTAPLGSGFNEWIARFSLGARRAIAMMASLMVGLLLVMTAGIVALATAAAGILLAAAALIVSLFRDRQPAASRVRPEGSGGSTILNARRTSRGWTVE